MVRETRHLWIGNLPENVREEQIRDLFQRHGRVQSVKLLSDEGSSGSPNGVRSSATVSFIDIRSASKALRAAVPTLSGQPLSITYHEPGSVPVVGRGVPVLDPAASPAGEPVPSPAEGPSNNNTPTHPAQGTTSNGPAGTPSGSGNSYRHQRYSMQHGQSEDSSSLFYEQPKGFSRGRGDGRGFHGGRGRREHRYHNNNRHSFPVDSRDRNYRMSSWGYPNEGRFAPPAHSEPDSERTNSGPPPSAHPPSAASIGATEPSGKGTRRPESPASSVSSRNLPSKRHQSRSVSESGSSDRGSSAGSRSRSGSRSSVSTSPSSGRSRSPSHHGSASGPYSGSRGGSSSGRFHNSSSYSRQRYSRSRVVSRAAADSSRARHSHSSRSPPMGEASPSSSTSSSPSPHRKVSTAPHSPSHSPSSTKSYSPSRSLNSSSSHHHHSHRKTPSGSEVHAAIKIRNLPARSSDTSLKDGLYHEYKKHGKVSWVRVIGKGPDRYAIVCFKSADHATRAISLSQDKHFFGYKIQVTPYQAGPGTGGEGLGGPAEEDNRLSLGEDEPFVTTYPSRNILIAGLDQHMTEAELRGYLDHCGEIVDLNIRRTGSHTYGICEFVDVSSAVKARWARLLIHYDKIMFYKSQPSTTILLDGGASGAGDKLVTGQVSQYGAISKIVVDSGRSMSLVQFEEISSALAAFRELKCWKYKGKQCHGDYLTPKSARFFLDRLPLPLSELVLKDYSPDLRSDSATPPSSIPGTPGKEPGSGTVGRRSNSGRRFSEFPNERRLPYRHSELESGSGLRIYNDEGVCPDPPTGLRNGPILAVNGTGENHHRRRFGRGSPGSPDPENSIVLDGTKKGTGGSKIDLSCHETDSAVVTSSSDVIVPEVAEPNDHHSPHPDSLLKHRHHSHLRSSNLIIINGDDRPHGNFESVGGSVSRNSLLWSKSHVVFGTVDGVSSTSPEPKNDTVRKASPDPGVGLEPVNPRILTETSNSPVLSDPRVKSMEAKIRRSSADSGNPQQASAFATCNKGAGVGAISVYSRETVVTTAGDDLDDRPGTPLCDENPEDFPPIDPLGRPASFKSEEPLSLPLPEFALKRHNSTSSTRQSSSSVSGTSRPGPNRSYNETNVSKASPPPPTVMTPPVGGVESPVHLPEKSTSSPISSSIKSTNVTDIDNRISPAVGGTPDLEILEEHKVVETTSVWSPPTVAATPLSSWKNSQILSDDDASPPSSPLGDNLDEQIAALNVRYDVWHSGNRTVSRSMGRADGEVAAVPEINGLGCGSFQYKPKLARSRPLHLNDLQPSDIAKALIAKKSVFDEDTKRLENFGDKYESKIICPNMPPVNWRLSFSNRSTSQASNSSTNSSLPQTPISASSSSSSNSNVFPMTPTTPAPRPHQSFNHAPTVSLVPSTPVSSKGPPAKRRDLSWDSRPEPVVSSPGKTLPKSVPPAPSPTKPTSTNPSPCAQFPPPLGRSVATSVPGSEPLKSKVPGVISTTNQTPTDPRARLTAQKSAPPPGIHQGIPRMVERSMSLDSKRGSGAPSVNTSATSSAGSSPSSVMSASSTSSQARRTSIDSQKEAPSLCSNQITVGSKVEAEPPRPKPKSESSKDPKYQISLNENINNNHVSKPTPSLTIISGTTNHKEVSSKFDLLKEDKDSRLHIHHLAEPTVAVVASIQPTPVLTPRTSGNSGTGGSNSTSGKEKDSNGVGSKKKEKEAINNNNSSTANNNSSKSKGRTSGGSSNPVTVNHNCKAADSSSSVPKQSGGKDEQKKKSGSSGGSSTSNGTREKFEHENSNSNSVHGGTGSSGSHHHKDKKKDIEPSLNSSSSSSHGHKKEKESSSSSSKAKRRPSTLELEPDHKRAKVEKEPEKEEANIQQPPPPPPPPPPEVHQHRKSTSSMSERRESRDSVSSNKDKVPKAHATTKSEKESSSGPPVPPKDKAEKSEKDKDHHHRSKSTSSSSSKHHHHEKGSSSTVSGSSHAHKDKGKKDKEKSSPPSSGSGKVKESSSNSKPPSSSSTKHSSSSSHHRSKDDKGSSSSSKTKDKERERLKEKQASTASVLDSDEGDNVDGGHEKDKNKRQSKSSGKSRRSRNKSGGDSSCGNDSSKGASSRSKSKEEKKQRRRVIDETDSSGSDDDEDKQKHHSIFEVVVDEYVSMYDKVKARSNRACKNVPASKQQQEEQKKHDKVHESFNQLKKSRAKREEKKRSTSVDDRKSMNTTTDDESHTEREAHHDHESEDELRLQVPPSDRERANASPAPSSSDEDLGSSLTPSLKVISSKSKSHSSKSKRRDKDKPGKASSNSGSITSKRSKKSNSKASPLRSSAFFLSHSDDDSPSQAPAPTKKRKLSSKHNVPSLTVVSSMTLESRKSSDESMSEPGEIRSQDLAKSSKKKHSSKTQRKLLGSLDIYSESDSSLHSSKEARKQISSGKSKKDKLSKKKSIDAMKRQLFDESETSEPEDKDKGKKEKDKDLAGRAKTKEGKSSRKKSSSHHNHGSSASGSKGSKRKRDRLSSGDGKNASSSAETSKGGVRKELPNCSALEDLFGPMTPSSASDLDESRPELVTLPVVAPVPAPAIHDDRPPTPTPLVMSKSFEETPVTTKKTKSSRTKQRRNSSIHESKPEVSSQPLVISQLNNGVLESPPVLPTPHIKEKSSNSSEKKKKKHHKRSKRLESHDSSVRTEHSSVDYDSLFSSPVHSPESVVPAEQEKLRIIPASLVPSPTKFTMYPPPPEIPSPAKNCNMVDEVKEKDRLTEDMRSMFSTDEDDDDDKLKIDISEAIMSAAGEVEEEEEEDQKAVAVATLHIPSMELREEPPPEEPPAVDEEALALAKMLEEEEKKRNCLFEQDKAIESILMERKSPPRMSMGPLGQIASQALDTEDTLKDDLAKDETSISQEETEDAVAALLETLDRDDDIECDEPVPKRVASPPTLSIPETSPTHGSQSGTESDKELLLRPPWYASPKSPKELQIDESEMSAIISRDRVLDGSLSPDKKKLTRAEAEVQLHEVLQAAKQAASQLEESELSGRSLEELGVKCPSRRESRSSEGALSGDVYEFHDSDDERHIRPAVSASPVHSPVKPSCPTPPSVSGPIEIQIEKLCPVTQQQVHVPPQPKLPSPLIISTPSVVVPEEPVSRAFVPVEPPVVPVHVVPIMHSPRAPVLASLSPVGRSKTPPVLTPYVRNSIDETIEEVVRGHLLLESTVPTLPILPVSRASPRGRGRSMSKDSNDDITATINRVACRDSSPEGGAGEPPVLIGSIGPKLPLPQIETRTDPIIGPHLQPISEALLIDPQTGLMTQMMRQTDEGQYVPVSGQELLKIPAHAFQQQPKAGGPKSVELERAGSIERVQQDPQPYQIQIQKNEGLPALLAQQQQQQQQNMMQLQQQQQQFDVRRKQQAQYLSQVQQHQAFQNNQQQVPQAPNVSTPNAAPKTPDNYKPVLQPVCPSTVSPPSSVPSYLFPTTSSPGLSAPPAMYGSTPPPAQLPNYAQQQQMMQQRVQDSSPVRPPASMIRAMGPTGHVPSPGQIQAQLVRIPQIPMATTITKIDSRSEQEQQSRKSSIIQHPSAVILTTTSSPVGSSITRGTMSGQPQQTHQLQARVHEGFGASQGPPRIDISTGTSVPSAAGSPKPGRAPQQQQHEQAQPLSGVHRMPTHMPYDPSMEPSSPAPLDLVTQSSHSHNRTNTNNNKSSTKNQQARQGDARLIGQIRPLEPSQFMQGLPQHQVAYPHHYPNIPVSMGGSTMPNIAYGLRPGSVESFQQQQSGPKAPPNAHLIPPHLSSPHLSDRGSAESPHLVPLYAQRQMSVNYNQAHAGGSQHHSPAIPTAHQQQLRQTFTHPYEFEEGGRIFAHSPGYNVQSLERERSESISSRDGSPFNLNANLMRRGVTPPPAHNGPRYGHLPGPMSESAVGKELSPHDSPVPPPQGELLTLLQRYPIMWQGMLALKNDSAICQFHFVSGNENVARESLPGNHSVPPDPPLRISQRMRLEQTQVDGVARKLQTEAEYAMLLALPCGRNHVDVLQQGNNLRSGFITYLQLKQAAGIVNIHHPVSQLPAYVIHIFPSCDFANENLARIAPDLLNGVADIAHLLIVIATV